MNYKAHQRLTAMKSRVDAVEAILQAERYYVEVDNGLISYTYEETDPVLDAEVADTERAGGDTCYCGYCFTGRCPEHPSYGRGIH